MLKNLFTSYTAYISPFVMFLFMLYLSLITLYSMQIVLELRTLTNIETYYDTKISHILKKDDFYEK